MIESIQFTNFKALRSTTLPLSPFTLLLGPNGSGKTTVLQALQRIPAIVAGLGASQGRLGQHGVRSSSLSVTATDPNAAIEIKLRITMNDQLMVATFHWSPDEHVAQHLQLENGTTLDSKLGTRLSRWLGRMQFFMLDATAIAQPVPVSSGPLQFNGTGLVAVLDDLKDNHPERWDLLLDELRRWLPEYDLITFEKPQQGFKGISLRTTRGRHNIAARDLSQGTLIALALLTLAYLPDPPSLIGLEEIDRGLHPRLLRHLQDALYRLSNPESCGEKRPPIQVIATTHSPYLLDLYRDHPEEVVLAQKEGLEVQFKRLSEIEHFGDMLGDSPLSEVWYSGVLGGVSVKP